MLFAQNLQDEMMDLMDVSSEIQETLGRSYNVPDDIDEEELMGGKFRCSKCLHADANIMPWMSEMVILLIYVSFYSHFWKK